jgi:hypothetical protein
MKFLRYFLFLLSAGIIFTSCQKEFSAETGSAQGTLLKDAGGDCTGFFVGGAYKKDTVLTTANYVDVQIDISQAGVYIITTDTVNGYSFRGAGSTALLGLNTIRLIAQGKPLAIGTDVFTVKFGGTGCQFNVNVTLGTGGGGTSTAKFTFPNTAGACAGATQTPNFFATIPTTPATHNITLKVDVTTAGTYNLTTTSANGLIFSGSGTLAIGTNQPIILTAVPGSAPTAAGTTTYTFSTTTPVASSCAFDLTVQAAPTPATFTINCATAATQTGTFQAGTALTLASKITISVTPTTTGSYSITTNTLNGVSYIGAGIFTTTTTQNVDLFANPLNNTPTIAGPFNYTTTGGTAPCTNVSVTYTAPPPSAATDSISATVNGVFKLFDDMPAIQMDNTTYAPFIAVVISGDSLISSPEGVQFGVANATGIIPTGAYTVNQGPLIFVGGQYTDDNNIDFFSTTLTAATNPTPAFTVTITSITGGALGASGTRVKGSFSGALKESAPGTGVKTITGGYFDLTFP